MSENSVNSDDLNESLFGDVSDIDDPTFIPPAEKDAAMLNNNSSDNIVQAKRLSRKRSRKPEEWKQNIRKKKREQGLEYRDIKGREHAERSVKGKCECRMKCSQKINEMDQNLIHKYFWKLSDNEKSHFYSKFVERFPKKRSRPRNFPSNKPEDCYKQFSYKYYFELSGDRVPVCKIYFFKTLDVSARRISYFFSKKYNHNTGVPVSLKKGKNTKKVTLEEQKEIVRTHIRSFPRIESHYCRANTSKEYLESNLNLSKMYHLYLEAHPENPVKLNIYRKIFDTEFNIGFHKPKKDRCDFCEEIKLKTVLTDEEDIKYKEHIRQKLECKEERDKDRKTTDNKKIGIISFDLENVFALPKANVSNFFYKRKFSVYNLTAHCSINNKTYCALWYENISGRAGNHISSALVAILTRIVSDLPAIKKIILWSDSCVAQNRKSVMSLALGYFLFKHPDIESIEQKYSESDHGNIQEIDSVHSFIERNLRYSEIYSPVSLLRCLNTISGEKGKLVLIQLKRNQFFDYQKISKTLNYNLVPYTKVKHLILKSDTPINYISYRFNFHDEFHLVRLKCKTRQKQILPHNLKPINVIPSISQEKKKDLQSMLKYMPLVDRVFYNNSVLK